MYDAWHDIVPLNEPAPGAEPRPVDIVGPVCESCDYFAKDRFLPPMQRGDYLCMFSAGAYGSVMSSNYNARPRSAEILVDGSEYHVIRRRETYEELIALEQT